MKLLGLIRHAKSDWDNPALEDFERPLNARGYRDSKLVSLRLKEAGIIPDYILTSAAIRAASTALIFSKTFHLQEQQIHVTPLLYAATETAFLEILRSLPDNSSCSFVFGHNDTLSHVAGLLARQPLIHVPTCGAVILETGVEKWKELNKCHLRLFDFPKREPTE
jgi:phosphohistidine phosphatase